MTARRRRSMEPSVWVVERMDVRGRWGLSGRAMNVHGGSWMFVTQDEARIRRSQLPANYRIREYRRVTNQKRKPKR